jgi:hypothetical protein
MHQIERYCDEVLYLNHGRTAHLGQTEAGVAQFMEAMNSGYEGQRMGFVDWTAVHGSGDIKFTGARFLDKDRQEIFEINAGDSVTLEIDYISMIEPGTDSLLDLVIRDQESIVFQSLLRFGDHFTHASSDESKIKIYFPRMAVNTNFLDFSFCSMNSSSKEIHDWKRNIRLKVKTRKNQSGRVLLEPVLT